MSDSEKVVCWISTQAKLPDTCVVCGMFTDHRVNVTCVSKETEAYESEDSVSGLGCLLTLLGPIGMFVNLILLLSSVGQDGSSMKTRTVKTKDRLSMPQCLLCTASGKVEPIDHDTAMGRVAFLVHPKFAEVMDSELAAPRYPEGFAD